MDPETEESHGEGSGKAEIRREEPDSYKLFLPTDQFVHIKNPLNFCFSAVLGLLITRRLI